ALGSAAASYDGDTQKLARDLLTKQLTRLNTQALKEKLKDDRPEVRAAAARVAGSKSVHIEKELIDLLADDEKAVWQAAHDALLQLVPATDFGPRSDASPADRKESAEKWRAWLERLSGR